jgi:FYVE/RhoGEF/PH domain-containing protein 5/6
MTSTEHDLSTSPPSERPVMHRQRSKSDAQLPTLRTTTRAAAQVQRISEGGAGMSSASAPPSKSRSMLPKARKKKRAPSALGEERWVYKGRVELVDVEVVVSPIRDEADDRRFEILSPESSFAVYAGKWMPYLPAARVLTIF